MQSIFGNIVQLKGQFRIFLLETKSGRFIIFTALVMSCAMPACTVHEIRGRKDLFVFKT